MSLSALAIMRQSFKTNNHSQPLIKLYNFIILLLKEKSIAKKENFNIW